MIKLSLNKSLDLDNQINNHHILGDFVFVSCPVDKENGYYSDLNPLRNLDDNKNVPEDFVFIPGPRF